MFEAWSVAVRVSLINQVGSGLLAMSRQFVRAHGDADKLQKKLDRIKFTLTAGAAAAGAGLFVLSSLRPALREAEAFNLEAAKFSLYGLGEKTNAEAIKYARSMNIIGTSSIQAMRLMNEAQGVFRESGLSGSAALEGAKIAAPVLAKMEFANLTLSPEMRNRLHSQNLDMLRFVEMRGGLQSPEKFNAIAEQGFKTVRSSGGGVDWSQLRQYMATAGVAAQYETDASLFGKMEPVINEMKGMRAGFAARTAYNRINGIVRIPNQVAHDLVENKIWDATKVEFNKQGGIKRFKGNPLIDSKLFAEDRVAFYEKYMLPMYARQGIGGPEFGAERARRNAMTFGSTGGAMFTLIDRQLPVIHRSVTAQQKALGINAAVAVAAKTPQGMRIAAAAEYSKLMQRMGEVILPLQIKALQVLVPLLEKVNAWAEANPGAFDGVVKGLMALGAALTVGGVVTIFAGAISGLGIIFGGIGAVLPVIGAAFSAVGAVIAAIGWPITLAVVAIAALAAGIWWLYKNWHTAGPKLKAVWNRIVSAVANFIGGIVRYHARAVTAFGRFLGAIGSFITGVISKARELVTKAGQLLGFGGEKPGEKPLHKQPHGPPPPFGSARGAAYERPGGPWTPSGLQRAALRHGDVYLDNERVGRVMDRRKARELGRPSTGASAYDPGHSLTPTNAGSFAL